VNEAGWVPENEHVHIVRFQCGHAHFSNAAEGVEKKVWGQQQVDCFIRVFHLPRSPQDGTRIERIILAAKRHKRRKKINPFLRFLRLFAAKSFVFYPTVLAVRMGLGLRLGLGCRKNGPKRRLTPLACLAAWGEMSETRKHSPHPRGVTRGGNA
jgi:hypothetical protein